MTPLHFSASNGHLNIVEYLINQKAYINAKSKDGETRLKYANDIGELDLVECIKNKGGQ